jgi:hypothetical protein
VGDQTTVEAIKEAELILTEHRNTLVAEVRRVRNLVYELRGTCRRLEMSFKKQTMTGFFKGLTP